MKRLVILFACIAALASGQTVEPEMSADRPGFRNSTHLVGRGVVQLENGLRLFEDGEMGNRRGVALVPNLRAGATNWLELRLSADIIVLRSPQPADPEHMVGASDLQVGMKVPIVGRDGGDLRVVGIVKTSLPTGHTTQSAHGYEPGSEIIFEQDLRRDFSLAGTWNLTRLKQEGFVWQHAGSIQLNRRFHQNWNTFVEVYGRAPQEVGGATRWVADVALTRTLGHNMILDTWVGRSVHGLRFWFAAVGLSVRTRTPRL